MKKLLLSLLLFTVVTTQPAAPKILSSQAKKQPDKNSAGKRKRAILIVYNETGWDPDDPKTETKINNLLINYAKTKKIELLINWHKKASQHYKQYRSEAERDGGGDWNKSSLKRLAKTTKHKAQAYAQYAQKYFNLILNHP